MTNNNTLNDLEKLKAELLSKVNNIDQTMSILKAMSFDEYNVSKNGNGHISEVATNLYKEYDQKLSIKSKLALVLRKENRFLHLREIADILHSHERGITVKDFINKLYPAIAD